MALNTISVKEMTAALKSLFTQKKQFLEIVGIRFVCVRPCVARDSCVTITQRNDYLEYEKFDNISSTTLVRQRKFDIISSTT